MTKRDELARQWADVAKDQYSRRERLDSFSTGWQMANKESDIRIDKLRSIALRLVGDLEQFTEDRLGGTRWLESEMDDLADLRKQIKEI